jgi:putative Ig domain-containing protein
MANKTDRLTVRSWLMGLWSHLSVNPLYCLREDRAQDRWLLFFASSISSIGLFFAVACLISCNGPAKSGRSSALSGANPLLITTVNHPAGYSGSVTDTVGSPHGNFSTVTPASVPSMSLRPAPLRITSGVLPAGAVQSDYDTGLKATGGVPPYHWDATAGKIAPGLTLRSSTGTISGIPFAPGDFFFTARVQDSTGTSLSTTLSLNISAASPATVSDVVPDEGSVDGGRVVIVSDQSLTPR